MDFVIVAVIVGAALAYAGLKAWNLFKPGPRAAGCGCSSAKSGCAGCPVMDLKKR